MKFLQVTSNKYIGDDGYTLLRGRDGEFVLQNKSSSFDRWPTFSSVRSAERFIDQVKSGLSSDKIITDDDLNFATIAYGLENNGDAYLLDSDIVFSVDRTLCPLTATFFYEDGQENVIEDADVLFRTLDEIVRNDIFSSVILRGSELRSIFAKRDSRSSREITKDLIRVKSSNVWSYGIEIKDNKAAKGDVYVQFKGKNGGPGDIYKYYDVPVNVWRKWVGAPSKGHFLWKYIRNNFPYSKLTGNKRGVLPNAVN